MRFWLLRHAPVLARPGIIYGPEVMADVTCTELLEPLRAALPTDARTFSSPALRAVETAHALAISPSIDRRLREQGFGQWTGLKHDDLSRSGDARYSAFWRAPASNTPPGGESFEQQIARTRSFADELISEGREAIVIAHAGTVRAFLSIALDILPERALSFVIDTLSITQIDFVANGWRINRVNSRR